MSERMYATILAEILECRMIREKYLAELRAMVDDSGPTRPHVAREFRDKI